MGTPEFAVPCLNKLVEENYELVAVVTQPDRPVGRNLILTPTPVKVAALTHHLTVWQPEKLRISATIEHIRHLKPDLIITVAYGQILPKSVLKIPRLGCINVHASLLPKYRGGAPIQRAIMNGDTMTGVTLMYMAEQMDTGDIIRTVNIPIMAEDNAGTMFEKLSKAGAQLLIQTLPELLAGRVQAIPQCHDQASYAPNLTRIDEQIDWSRSAYTIYNQVRAVIPFSGAYTHLHEDILKIWGCRLLQPKTVIDNHIKKKPGTILTTSCYGIEVQTGKGTIWITDVQPAGKKRMSANSFVCSGKLCLGMVLQ